MTLTAVSVARLCPVCGVGEIGDHCGAPRCPWEKCDLCRSTTKRPNPNIIMEET